MHAFDFYATCTLGGVISCGLTHTGVTPLDNIKCNMQANPSRYKSISSGFNKLLNKHGMGALFRGWVPTFLGYSSQGALKFGFYEFFKEFYSDIVGTQNAEKHKTLIYLAGSASAEFIAGIALCPFEAIKVRMQTSPDLAKGSLQAFYQILASGGCSGLYKGLVPLWGRQIPYTMVKFACFEKTVESIYKYAIPIPKEECPKAVQLGVSFAAGYIAGISCALVSHPADNLVSVLNSFLNLCRQLRSWVWLHCSQEVCH
ncbi:mitochondrial phosphate carrier protein 3, mitochondrial isoform X2 [Cryptomeria japonica]|uniref:mitochondrial phosphate carrier protein 3, mitochondrial isoform X2 n=1 Tax=Cryptomeria japonica TaxID=3369 RepID=UPI0027D9E8B4|nr:mitochondrial phosphate carrier protein 3, mitochondrial isoform X2 [Cryptomeria japonica]